MIRVGASCHKSSRPNTSLSNLASAVLSRLMIDIDSADGGSRGEANDIADTYKATA